MKDESRVASGVDETSMSTRMRMNTRRSRSASSSPPKSNKDSSEQKSRRDTSNNDDSASKKRTVDASTKEREKRNHFTRSRKPKASTTHETKADEEAKLVGFLIHRINLSYP